jgi:hypothetical protein
MLRRRGLISGVVGLVASPAVVRATSIMPVKSFIEIPKIIRHTIAEEGVLYIELARITRKAVIPLLYKTYFTNPNVWERFDLSN